MNALMWVSVQTKETYIHGKETYIHGKETYIHGKETYIHGKENYEADMCVCKETLLFVKIGLLAAWMRSCECCTKETYIHEKRPTKETDLYVREET